MISPDHVYTALDVETTGLDPAVDRIIEIALVALDRNAREIGVLDTLVSAGPGVSAGRSDLHGVRDEMLAAAPHFADIAARVSAFVAGTVPVAHYAKFDMGFLNAELDRAGLPMPAVASICTIEAARAGQVDGPYGLAHVAAKLKVDEDACHHALPDTRTCAGVFRKLLLRGKIDAAALARVRHARPAGEGGFATPAVAVREGARLTPRSAWLAAHAAAAASPKLEQAG